MYTKRHDRIVDHLFEKLKVKLGNNECTIITNTCIDTEQHQHNNIPNKPDIFIRDEHNKKIFIIEVSTPFDCFIDLCFHEKFFKYTQLNNIMRDKGYNSKIIVIIVGALGTVHKKTAAGLKLLGFSNREITTICKYISISSLIGSNIIWQKRARKIFLE